jgi:hypothetical protein
VITVEFLITSLIVVRIPGTGVVFTLSTGLVQGRRASVFAAVGCTAGIKPHLLATELWQHPRLLDSGSVPPSVIHQLPVYYPST